jgi:indole-3-glycerol phosphate synthase
MNILEQIIEVKKEEVSVLKKKFSLNSFRDMKFFESETMKFSNKLIKNNHISIIAEIKKASPSKGVMREDFNHKKIADIYFEEDVEAVSVLTDKNFFRGDLNFLSDIANEKRSPLLRKDFIINELQVFESKAYGADIILLIAEVLSKNQIHELSHAAFETGMEVLLEFNSEKQIDKIDFSLNKLIGINNRNLNDFSVDLTVTKILREKIPSNVFVVSESGISKRDDVKYLYDSGTNALLVGEFLLKAKDIKSRLKKLKEWCEFED